MNSNLTEEDTWQLNLTGKIVITTVLGSIILVGLIGNVLVILLIPLVKKLHSTVNVCLWSLAVADLLVLVIAPIIPLLDLYDADHSIVGRNLCVFFRTGRKAGLVCSTGIFLLIAVERYTVLCHPLKSLGWWTHRKVTLTLVVIWAVSIGICIPYGFATRYRQLTFGNSTGTFCYYSWENGWLESYETALLCLFFFVPVPTLILLYGKMILTLKSTVLQNRNQPFNANSAKSRVRVVFMLAILIVIFVICLLPFKIYVMIYLHAPGYAASEDFRSHVIFAWSARAMMYVNHACNPLVYFLMSDNFREAFRRLFCMSCKSDIRIPDVDRHGRSGPVTARSASK